MLDDRQGLDWRGLAEGGGAILLIQGSGGQHAPRYGDLLATGFKHRILVVDDDDRILHTSQAVLESKGYEVRTARDGFEALIELRSALPDVIITDLGMPNMSGFELLSVVRKRFPQISAIAISGQYAGGSGGLIADAFFGKGQFKPEGLFTKVAALIAAGPPRQGTLGPCRAPVWTPLNADGYYIVTCNECLRSSPIAATDSDDDLRHAECMFCGAQLSFLAVRTANTFPKRRQA